MSTSVTTVSPLDPNATINTHTHTHSTFSPISSSAGQHFVDTDDVEWMQTHTDVETILTAGLHHVLVGTDTGSLQSYMGGCRIN